MSASALANLAGISTPRAASLRQRGSATKPALENDKARSLNSMVWRAPGAGSAVALNRRPSGPTAKGS